MGFACPGRGCNGHGRLRVLVFRTLVVYITFCGLSTLAKGVTVSKMGKFVVK
jgi:hypothetical protein